MIINNVYDGGDDYDSNDSDDYNGLDDRQKHNSNDKNSDYNNKISISDTSALFLSLSINVINIWIVIIIEYIITTIILI